MCWSVSSNRFSIFVVVLVLFAFGATGSVAEGPKILSGSLSGTIVAGEYSVPASVRVEFGEELTIEPGTTLCFSAGAEFLVQGFLNAEGRTDAPIRFSSCDRAGGWSGIRFDASKRFNARVTRLSWAIVEFANTVSASGDSDSRRNGGGLSFSDSDAIIDHSTIRDNVASNGGGVYVRGNSDVQISSSAIYRNTATPTNYIYNGGGGLYLDSPDAKLRISNSIVALNSFITGNYSNEEGGGGLYWNLGELSVNQSLFFGNRSGRGPAILVNAKPGHTSKSQAPRTLYGNIFVGNSGGREFEQISIMTRYLSEVESQQLSWEGNLGQFPFVARVVRDGLVDYLDYGVPLPLLNVASRGQAGDPRRDLDFIAASKIPSGEVALSRPYSSFQRHLCGDQLQLGPERDCSTPETVWGLLSAVAMAAPDREFSTALVEAFPKRSQDQTVKHVTVLLNWAISSAMASSSPDSFEAIVRGSCQDGRDINACLDLSTVDSRGYTPAIWLFLLGDRQGYANIIDSATDDQVAELLRNTSRSRIEQASLQILANRGQSIERKVLVETLLAAANLGEVKLAATLIDTFGVDPKLPLVGQLPLNLAAAKGDVAMTTLLLRRDADPNAMSTSAGLPPRSPLTEGLQWYHLQDGFSQTVELLMAAGANIELAELAALAQPSPLQLHSLAKVGLPQDSSWLRDAVSSATGAEFERSILESLRAGQVSVDPVIANILKLRDMQTDEIVTLLASTTDVDVRVALLRILQSRPLALTEEHRSVVFQSYNKPDQISGRYEVRLDQVIGFYPQGSKGAGNLGPVMNDGQSTDTSVARAFSKKYAVVIGISDYADMPQFDEPNPVGLRDLQFAEKDAVDMAAMFRAGHLGPDWDIIQLTGRDATQQSVRAALAVLASNANPDDLVVFYFSGHGSTIAHSPGRTFLVLQDTEQDALAETAIPLRDIRDWALSLRANHVILFLDACHAGFIGAAKGNPPAISYADLQTKQITSSARKVAITASFGLSLSFEDKDAQNGYFTQALLDILTGRKKISNSQSYLTIAELMIALGEIVPNAVRSSGILLVQDPDYTLLAGVDIESFPLVFFPQD